jgi:hypothetical protein
MDHSYLNYYTIISILIMVNLVAVVMIIDHNSTSCLLQDDKSCVSTAYSLIMVSFVVVMVVDHRVASNICQDCTHVQYNTRWQTLSEN